MTLSGLFTCPAGGSSQTTATAAWETTAGKGWQLARDVPAVEERRLAWVSTCPRALSAAVTARCRARSRSTDELRSPPSPQPRQQPSQVIWDVGDLCVLSQPPHRALEQRLHLGSSSSAKAEITSFGTKAASSPEGPSPARANSIATSTARKHAKTRCSCSGHGHSRW